MLDHVGSVFAGENGFIAFYCHVAPHIHSCHSFFNIFLGSRGCPLSVLMVLRWIVTGQPHGDLGSQS